MNYIRIRFKVILSTETFSGQYHTGPSSQAYEIAIPMGIFENSSGQLYWGQERDRQGHTDPRLPQAGEAEVVNGDLVLTHMAGARQPVAVLEGFDPRTAEGRGVAVFTYMASKTYAPPNPAKPASFQQWRGKGNWEVLRKEWAATKTDFVGSGWTFVTSGGGGGGVVLAASGGKFILADPQGREWQFYYGSIGAGGGLKGLSVKGVKIPLNAPVNTAKFGSATMSGGGSMTAFPNKGLVYKNPLWLGARELTKEDFLGTCLILDGAAVVGAGVGGTSFWLGADWYLAPIMFAAAARAGVVAVGLTAGLGVGGGGYVGRVWGAW